MLMDWIRFIRPANAVIAGLGAALGYACVPGPYLWAKAALGFAAMASLAAAGNAHNDVLDLETDRVNRPNRALPAGLITPRTAGITAAALYLLALAAAFASGYPEGLLALAMALLLYTYNHTLKALPIGGNLAVSVLCALTLYYSEFPSFPAHTGLPAVFALLSTWARELAKDAEDIPGDLATGRNTFPIRYGPVAARWMVGVLAVLLLLLLPVPMLFLHYRSAYALPTVWAALPLLLLILYSVSKVSPQWGKVQRYWKWFMLAGMLAILAGVRGI